MSDLFAKLKSYKGQLPGAIAHYAMAPKLKGDVFRDMQAKEHSRKSAVALLLYENNNVPQILLTRRSLELKHHPGQLSFPGGKIEDGETPSQAAIRETREEVGISESDIEFLMPLSKIYVDRSDNLISPFVYKIKNPKISIAKSEVDSYCFVDLLTFRKDNIKHKDTVMEGKQIDVPFWEVNCSVPLWGVTAMILNELVEVISTLKK